MLGATKATTPWILLASLTWAVPAFVSRPDASKTPGAICTESDPDFAGYHYPTKVALCRRNVSIEEKRRVAQEYGGIPESDWKNYEFDHLIPLSIGGSNDIRNIWPQPIAEARVKDVLEDQLFRRLEGGVINQEEALRKIQDWVEQN